MPLLLALGPAARAQGAGEPPTAGALNWWLLGALSAAFMAAVVWALMERHRARQYREDIGSWGGRFGALLDGAQDAVFIYGLEGDRVSRIRHTNAAACAALGMTREAVLGRSLGEFSHDEEGFAQHLDGLRKAGVAQHRLHLRCGDGDPVPFEMRSHVIEVGDEVIAMTVARDARERRALEDRLRTERRDAVELARAKAELLASMSHEIRTPLTAVIGFAELLRAEVAPEQREMAVLIETSGRRLLSTLNSILDLSRLDAGRVELSPERVDVALETRAVCAVLSPLAEKKGVALHCLGADDPIPAYLDPHVLDRVLTNIAGNAVKFTEEGSVTIRVEAEEDLVRFAISDTGPGVDPDFLPHLFDEFKQGETAARRRGSGLGLAITKRLLDLAGGQVTVTSEVGRGTTFRVTLPREAPAAAAPDGEAAPDGAADPAAQAGSAA